MVYHSDDPHRRELFFMLAQPVVAGTVFQEMRGWPEAF